MTILLVSVVVASIGLFNSAQVSFANGAATTQNTTCWVTTTNSATAQANNPFDVGDTVYVWWIPAPNDSTVTIQIFEPESTAPLITYTDLAADDVPITFFAAKSGIWTIKSTGASEVEVGVKVIPFLGGFVQGMLVVPETTIGTLMAIIVGIAAFLIVKGHSLGRKTVELKKVMNHKA